ncbi:AraC family transcriptional regulator, partial [Sesbania bispinosa]
SPILHRLPKMSSLPPPNVVLRHHRSSSCLRLVWREHDRNLVARRFACNKVDLVVVTVHTAGGGGAACNNHGGCDDEAFPIPLSVFSLAYSLYSSGGVVVRVI